MIEVGKHFEFEAAHFLPDPMYGKCQRVHGHTYKLVIQVTCLDICLKNHMVVNFSDLSKIVKEEIIDRFDHTVLNESTGLEYPTAEELIMLFCDILREKLPADIILRKIKLYETSNSFAEWNS